MSDRTKRLSRRKFLLTAGAGSVATAAAIVAKNTTSPASGSNQDAKRATRGYHASEHINNYYRTTKV